ncbi:phage portal protein [Acidipropionibacterium timonense]|uniref:phage portal protein n=1 Tax=Acidipropionibacterium timonense TaxID=2161818 RepID=UPI001FD940C9|nr:phage portal protein [Acidipropionibacterium timonense]
MSLSADEMDLASRMHDRLKRLRPWHRRIEGYYEGNRRVRQLGVAIPPELQRITSVVSWPAIAVDALDERLDWLGWTGGADLGLDDVYMGNQLATESGASHLDALIFGMSFVVVLSAGDGTVSVRPQSPKNATGIMSPDGHTLSAGLIEQETDDISVVLGELLTEEWIVSMELRGDRWTEKDRMPNTLGRVPMVPIVNRRRTSRQRGRSEITPALRSYTDEAVRTLLGQTVNREFYAYPQRWIMGVSSEEFEQPGWMLSMASLWAVDKDEDGDTPTVGSFPVNSPAPYADQVRLLAQLASGESAVPERYFGFVTANPPSSDALASEEARLVKRAERRQVGFGFGWSDVGLMVALALGNDIDATEFHRTVRPRWRDASTPTRAATADAVTKLVGAGIIPADSRVVLEMLGMDDASIDSIMTHRSMTAPDPLTSLADAITKQTV